MSKEIVARERCDRCKKVYGGELAVTTTPEHQEESKPVFYMEFEGSKVVFEDLCPSCEKRVPVLVADICLNKSADKAETKSEEAPEEDSGGDDDAAIDAEDDDTTESA